MGDNSRSGSFGQYFSSLYQDFVQYFDCFYKDPDPKDYNPGTDHRWKWRPISQSPFQRKPKAPELDPPDTTAEDPVIEDNEAPKWVHLFYDLAWTTTFSNLTQNGRFNQPWDTVSYLAFFIIVWWIWAAQAMYTIHFYTNDWFHFGSNIVQLCIFGMLSATTRGYDISNYIVHSPGSDQLEDRPQQLTDIDDPEIYSDEIIAATSLKVIAISVTISRIVLLVQYLRVIFHARAAVRKGTNSDVIQKISIVPLGMLVSIPLFVASWMISTSSKGKTPYGANLKYVLWGVALIVEIVSHIVMSRLPWRRPSVQDNSAQNESIESELKKEDPARVEFNRGVSAGGKSELVPASVAEPPSTTDEDKLPIPYSNVTLAERLEGITTIILGEGINGIAGTLWAVISAPGYEKSVSTNALSAAVTVCFITYFYFEGPRSRQNPKGLRQMIWLLLHLPFLLGIILLLLGVKDQFLLTSFLSTVFTSLEFPPLIAREGVTPLDPSTGDNKVVKAYFLKRGVSWPEAWQNLTTAIGPIEGGKLNQTQNFEVIAWQWRLALRLCIKTFETFMGEERELSDDITSSINTYYTNRTIPVLDNRASNAHRSTDTMEYYRILDTLVDANVQGARYIIGLAGGVLICLSLLSLTHSKPRDRFQWGIVLSRFAMGWSLAFLLLLNLGRYQTLWIYSEQKTHQAGVFQWLTVFWALPTIALAHLIELVIETFITGLARLRIDEITRGAPEKAEATRMVEEAKQSGNEVSNEVIQAAESNGRPLWKLAQDEIREGLVLLRLRKPNPGGTADS